MTPGKCGVGSVFDASGLAELFPYFRFVRLGKADRCVAYFDSESRIYLVHFGGNYAP